MESEFPTVEVVYALPQEQAIVQVAWRADLTAERLVQESGLLSRYPAAAREPLVLAVFGVRIANDAPVSPGDRIEICRPLLADPRELRRALVRQGRVVGLKTRE